MHVFGNVFLGFKTLQEKRLKQRRENKLLTWMIVSSYSNRESERATSWTDVLDTSALLTHHFGAPEEGRDGDGGSLDTETRPFFAA